MVVFDVAGSSHARSELAFDSPNVDVVSKHSVTMIVLQVTRDKRIPSPHWTELELSLVMRHVSEGEISTRVKGGTQVKYVAS